MRSVRALAIRSGMGENGGVGVKFAHLAPGQSTGGSSVASLTSRANGASMDSRVRRRRALRRRELADGAATRRGCRSAHETLLQRVVRLVRRGGAAAATSSSSPAPSKSCRRSPTSVRVVRDDDGDRAAAGADRRACAICRQASRRRSSAACDAPLLQPGVRRAPVRRLASAATVDDAGRSTRSCRRTQRDCIRLRPRIARTCRARLAAAAIAAGRASLHGALRVEAASAPAAVSRRRTASGRSRSCDSLVNCNTPEEYERALRSVRLSA